MRNTWLEQQTPRAKQVEQLRREVAKKKEILYNKDNMMKLLDVDSNVDNVKFSNE